MVCVLKTTCKGVDYISYIVLKLPTNFEKCSVE